jgi:hypothetical protein
MIVAEEARFREISSELGFVSGTMICSNSPGPKGTAGFNDGFAVRFQGRCAVLLFPVY